MRVLSGIQTSGNGELHIGNYIGAIKQWIALQDEHEAFYMLANLHAITVPNEPEVIKENVYKGLALYLALGLDPKKATIFAQSMVPAHAELTWLLNTVAYMGEMRRMTQFKDKAGDDQEAVSVGLFDYPVLMAADILLYKANQVPVGDDQKQHIELARNLADRFNKRYGETFVLPEPMMPAGGSRIMALDNPEKKMSKSGNFENFLSLLEDTDKIREKVMKAVTDSDNTVRYDPENKKAISNLLTIFSAVSDRPVSEIEADFAGKGYGEFKTALAEAVIAFVRPIQEKYRMFSQDQTGLDKILYEGAEKASLVANETLRRVKDKMGIL